MCDGDSSPHDGTEAGGWLHCDLGHRVAAVPNVRFGHLATGRFQGANVVASVVPSLSVIGHFAKIDGGCPSMLLLPMLLSAATPPPLTIIV